MERYFESLEDMDGILGEQEEQLPYEQELLLVPGS